ncbi:MAG: putative bifunctional diguanylate cyclase/phosphodiesterase [Mariprofundaceae bacterium]
MNAKVQTQLGHTPSGASSLSSDTPGNGLSMVWIAIILAAIFWFFEPVVYSFVMKDGEFIKHWLQPDQEQVQMRTAIVALLLLFGLYAQLMLIRQKQAYAQLERSSQLLRLVVDNAHDAFFSINATGKIIDWNPAAESMFGWPREEVLGRDITLTIITPEHRQTFSDELKSFAESEQTKFLNLQSETSLWHRESYEFPAEISIVPLRMGNSLIFNGFARDISARRLAEDRLKQLAHTDVLTGLPNRQSFNTFLLQELGIARHHQQKLAVMFLDLDHFKAVNDSIGHDAGDQLLRETAKRLQDCIRDSDTIARLGGDEFVFILPNLHSNDEPSRICERILSSMRKPFYLHNHECFVGASIGISIFPRDGETLEILEKHADIAMYRAKEAGKNGFKYYEADMSRFVLKRMKMERAMRHALERDELKILYQPQVNIGNGTFVGLESLVRWQHPEMGTILPDEFISFAEETGLILPLGEHILRTTCEQGRAWLDAGLPALQLAVNFTPRQFADKGLVEMVAGILNDSGFPPEYLEVEITESSAMENIEVSQDVLHELKKLGVKVAIDDFGTGFSSLGYLKSFPITALKIDRTFIAGVTNNDKDAAIVTTIIELAHNLGLKVIAEGVEVEEQLAFLRKHHCNFGQGYLFSKPLTADKIPDFIQASNAIT